MNARMPSGCAFAARCPLADAHCVDNDPALVADEEGRRVACWHADVSAARPVLAGDRGE